jgi:hypothetical protein
LGGSVAVTIVDVHGYNEFIGWVLGRKFDKCIWVAWGLVEAVILKQFDKVLIIYVVALFESIMSADNFAKGAAIGRGEFFCHACAKLSLTGMFSGERVVVKEGSGDVEIEGDKWLGSFCRVGDGCGEYEALVCGI